MHIKTCVNGSAFESRAGEFEGFHKIYEKQWGFVMASLVKLEPLLMVIRATWEENKFMAEATAAEKQRETKFDAKAVTRIMKDVLFFAYTRMLLHVKSIPEALGAWAEACPCCEHVSEQAPLPPKSKRQSSTKTNATSTIHLFVLCCQKHTASPGAPSLVVEVSVDDEGEKVAGVDRRQTHGGIW